MGVGSDRVRSSFASGNGHGPSRAAAERFRESGALHAQALGGLTRFVEDPRIPLDNNAAERALRGTEVAAACYTLCETVRLVGVDPRAYLLRAVYAAIGRPRTVTFPEDLLASTLTG